MTQKLNQGLWAWGNNASNAMGVVEEDGEEKKTICNKPRFVRDLPFEIDIINIACGNQHSVLLSRKGEVYTWGSGAMGKLGHMDQVDQSVPKRVEFLVGSNVSQIVCGSDHTMCLIGPLVYSWGCGYFGRLGHSQIKHEYQPRVVGSIKHVTIHKIAAGGATSACIDNGNNLWMWGAGRYGQMGTNKREDLLFPVMVVGGYYDSVAMSERHVAALRDGKLYVWGSNENSQLGDGRGKDLLKPTEIPFLHSIGSISCGRTYTAFTTASTGEVFVMGQGEEGQLGLGLVKEALTPTAVKFEDNTSKRPMVKVSCGEHHMVVLSDSGEVFVCGSDKLGQLGLSGNLVVKSAADKKKKIEYDSKVTADDFSLDFLASNKKARTKSKFTAARAAKVAQTTSKNAENAATAATGISKLRMIKHLSGVEKIYAGLFHTIAVIRKDHVVSQIALDGDLVSLNRLASIGWECISSYGREAAFIAAKNGHLGVLSAITKAQPMTLNQTTKIQNQVYTPLLIASRKGHHIICKYLIDQDANKYSTDSQSNSCLHLAAKHGHLEVCHILISGGVDPRMKDDTGHQALDYLSLEQVYSLKVLSGAYDIAICCCPSDMSFAKDLQKHVEKYHMKCGLPEDNPDQEDFVKGAKAIIFVLSGASSSSDETIHYLRLAKKLHKDIYPIWKEQVKMTPSLESLVYRLQLVDFSDPTKQHTAIAMLTSGLRNIFERKEFKKESEVVAAENAEDLAKAMSSFVVHPEMAIQPADLLASKRDYIYICHSPEDEPSADLLSLHLWSHGFICSTYTKDSSMVSELISNCWVFLMMISSSSAESMIIRDRIALAENRQRMILPVIVQKAPIQYDPAMTYTLARIPKFLFFVGDKDLEFCVTKLVSAIRVAKKLSETSESVKALREEVRVLSTKVVETDVQLSQLKEKLVKVKQVKRR